MNDLKKQSKNPSLVDRLYNFVFVYGALGFLYIAYLMRQSFNIENGESRYVTLIVIFMPVVFVVGIIRAIEPTDLAKLPQWFKVGGLVLGSIGLIAFVYFIPTFVEYFKMVADGGLK